MSEQINLNANLDEIETKIQAACRASGRDRSEVTLLAVTKTHPVEVLQEAYDLGLRRFGENKVQELVGKSEVLPNDIEWHMIGHLQRNKVKKVIEHIALLHSVESVRLAETLEKEAAKCSRVLPILIEVNVAGEESKFGLSPEETPDFVREIAAFPHIRVVGLMTSAPNVSDPEENRPVFKKLRNLAVDIKNQNIDNVTMNVLSMGMTNDYPVAIEEGATIVRVGTALFGHRDYGQNDK